MGAPARDGVRAEYCVRAGRSETAAPTYLYAGAAAVLRACGGGPDGKRGPALQFGGMIVRAGRAGTVAFSKARDTGISCPDPARPAHPMGL
jgi:hypothetical protein